LALLAVAGVAAWRMLDKPSQQQAQATAAAAVRTAKVTSGKMDVMVRVAGQTSAREFANITAPIMRGPDSGREMILLYLVPTGSRVKKGQMVAQIDAQSILDHMDDIRDDIEKAQGDIRKRKAEQGVDMASLLQTIKVSQSDYEKAKLDASVAEVRTEVEREILKLSAEEAEARYKQVQGDVAQKKIIYEAEIKILGVTLERHKRHLERHRVDVTKLTMNASMDGLAVAQQVYRSGEMSTIQQGDQVYPGQLFVKVVNPAKMQVEANINQAESSQFRINQTASVKFDAFPGVTLPGHIYSIGALAAGGFRQQYYLRNIPVRVAIDSAHDKVIPDLSGAADVLVETSQGDVKQVPVGAVNEDGGNYFVYVRKGKGFERRAVEVGLKNATHASIKSGLEVGDEVALEAPTAPEPEVRASL
jgi:hypothetical protein